MQQHMKYVHWRNNCTHVALQITPEEFGSSWIPALQ